MADEANPSQTQEEVEEEVEEEAEEEEIDDIDDDEEESTQDDDDDEVPEAIDEDSESGTHLRRSTRPRAEREILTARTFTGKSYAQVTRDGATPVPEYLKNVSYAQAHEKIAQIEECHNLKGTPEKI